MSKLYRCLGGWITSRSDGDRHFISASKVAELYRVNPSECIFINPEDHPNYEPQKGYDLSQLTDLWPREDGDYTLTSSGPTSDTSSYANAKLPSKLAPHPHPQSIEGNTQ